MRKPPSGRQFFVLCAWGDLNSFPLGLCAGVLLVRACFRCFSFIVIYRLLARLSVKTPSRRNPRRTLAVYPSMRIETDDWCMQGERGMLRDLLVMMLPAEPTAATLATES